MRTVAALVADLQRCAERGGPFGCSPAEAALLVPKLRESVAYHAQVAAQSTRGRKWIAVRPSETGTLHYAVCAEHGWRVDGPESAVRREVLAHELARHLPLRFTCRQCEERWEEPACPDSPHGPHADLCCECFDLLSRAGDV
jgi:hypothetical protein